MTEEEFTPTEEMPEASADETAVSPIASPSSVSDLKPRMKVTGTVKRIELYGAFVDIGVGQDAIIHISQLGDRRVNRVDEVMQVGDQIEAWIDRVDPERKQITLTMMEPLAVDWSDLAEGKVFTGKVTRLESFGVFVDIGAEKEGLVHISEMSHNYIKHPSEVVAVGDEIQVQVLSFKKRKRRINLSMKALIDRPESEAVASTADVAEYEEFEEDFEMPTAMEIALRRAMGDDAPLRPRRDTGSRRRKSRRDRRQQDEILSRTLNLAKEK